VPVVWDETHVLQGEIGQHITIARRKGNDWFIGSVTNTEARKLKIPPAAIAEALGMDVKGMKAFVEQRSATTETGEVIPLPAGALNLGGKTLTPVQEHYARTANGCMPEMYINMLLNAIRADSVLINEKTLQKLGELYDEIGRILKEAA
jgi:hypothetical protein